MILELLGSFLWLVVILILVSRWKGKIDAALLRILYGLPVVGCFTVSFVALIFMPGTIMHEVSHYVAAKLAGCKDVKLSLCPERRNGIILGMVRFDAQGVDSPFLGLTGIAPLIVGSLVSSLILWHGFGITPLFLYREPEPLVKAFQSVARGFVLNPNPLLLYLFFVCGNLALPSKENWEHWQCAFLMLLVCALFLSIISPATISALSILERWSLGISTLALTFTVIFLLDFVLLLPLGFLSSLIGRDPDDP